MTDQDKIKKFVDEAKIHKLINRIYYGDCINDKQFLSVYDYICKKGTKSSAEQKWSRIVNFDKDFGECEQNIVQINGHSLFGMFAYTDSADRLVILYYDVRLNLSHKILYYKNKNIVVHG